MKPMMSQLTKMRPLVSPLLRLSLRAQTQRKPPCALMYSLGYTKGKVENNIENISDLISEHQEISANWCRVIQRGITAFPVSD